MFFFFAMLATGLVVGGVINRTAGQFGETLGEYGFFLIVGVLAVGPLVLARLVFSENDDVMAAATFCSAVSAGALAGFCASMVSGSMAKGDSFGQGGGGGVSWLGLPVVLLFAAIPAAMISGVIGLGAYAAGKIIGGPEVIEAHASVLYQIFIGLTVAGFLWGGIDEVR